MTVQYLAVGVLGAALFGGLLLINTAIAVSLLGAAFEFIYPWLASKTKLTEDFSLANIGLSFFTLFVILIAFFFGVGYGILSVALLSLTHAFMGRNLDPAVFIKNSIVHVIIALAVSPLKHFGLKTTGTILIPGKIVLEYAFNAITGNIGFLFTPKIITDFMNAVVSILLMRVAAALL